MAKKLMTCRFALILFLVSECLLYPLLTFGDGPVTCTTIGTLLGYTTCNDPSFDLPCPACGANVIGAGNAVGSRTVGGANIVAPRPGDASYPQLCKVVGTVPCTEKILCAKGAESPFTKCTPFGAGAGCAGVDIASCTPYTSTNTGTFNTLETWAACWPE